MAKDAVGKTSRGKHSACDGNLLPQSGQVTLVPVIERVHGVDLAVGGGAAIVAWTSFNCAPCRRAFLLAIKARGQLTTAAPQSVVPSRV